MIVDDLIVPFVNLVTPQNQVTPYLRGSQPKRKILKSTSGVPEKYHKGTSYRELEYGDL